jgi:hypothetical protein
VARSLALARAETFSSAVEQGIRDRLDPHPRQALSAPARVLNLLREHRRHVGAEITPEVRREGEQ